MRLFSRRLEEEVEMENVLEFIAEENELTTVCFADRQGQKEEEESKESGQTMQSMGEQVSRMLERMEALEREVRQLKEQLKEKVANGEKGPGGLATAEINPVKPTHSRLWSDVVKEGVKREVKMSDGVHGQNKAVKLGKNNKSSNRTSDVITDTSHDVRSKSDDTIASGTRLLPDKQKISQSLPNVAFFSDSILRGVNERRLGKSYGFFASSTKAYTIEDTAPAIEECLQKNKTVEAIVIHSGINNLKRDDPMVAGKKMSQAVQNIGKRHPHLKIIVSKPAPTRQPELEKKRFVYNSLLNTELFGVKNVSLVHHENRQYAQNLPDGIHPSVRGSSVLARNLGRVIRNLFWELPRAKRNRWRDKWWIDNIQNW